MRIFWFFTSIWTSLSWHGKCRCHRSKKQLLKARINDSAFSSFNSCNKNSAPLNLTKEEFASLKSLSKKVQFIQKSGKGNSIAIINKDDYLQKMWNILSDSSMFPEVCIAKEKAFKFFNQHRETNFRFPKTAKWLSSSSDNAKT